MSVVSCHDRPNTSRDAVQIKEQYQRTGELLTWPVPVEMRSAVKVTYRNRFAEHLATKHVEEIVRRHVYLSSREMLSLVRQAERRVLSQPLRGIGIELGAGCGLLSSTLATSDAVQAMLAVEVCEQAARRLIPRVARGVLDTSARKVVPIVGSFDDLRLPDESVDFAVEIDSLHHSDNLTHTLTECARVLRPNGVLLCFDRCHDNDLSDARIDEMLAKVYSREFLIANNYPADVRLTRRENGEHEYRSFEWQAAFDAAGFKLERQCEFLPSVRLRRAIKGVISVLPRFVTTGLYESNDATLKTTAQWIGQQFRRVAARFGTTTYFAPRRTTVFLLRKLS